MYKDDIRIRRVIVHIMDSTVGMPVLSDTEIEFGSDLADFLKEHIYKIVAGDDCKVCHFYKEESEVYKMLVQYDEDYFIDISKDMGNFLYQIMNSNIDIPPADLMVVRFDERDNKYLAVLKMNYKEFYTHRTQAIEDGNENQIIKYKSILPTESQRLQEAAIINLSDLSVHAIEKKYDVNGEKTNYFTYLFLKCSSKLSPKSKLSIVSRAVESVQNSYYDETKQFEANMKAKNIIHQELEENGSFTVEAIADKIFEEKPDLKQEFQEKMEKYDMVREEIKPQNEKTMKKYETQVLKTDSGIEIKIPMKEYNDPSSVEFITEDNGNVSVLIKNIGYLKARI